MIYLIDLYTLLLLSFIFVKTEPKIIHSFINLSVSYFFKYIQKFIMIKILTK